MLASSDYFKFIKNRALIDSICIIGAIKLRFYSAKSRGFHIRKRCCGI